MVDVRFAFWMFNVQIRRHDFAGKVGPVFFLLLTFTWTFANYLLKSTGKLLITYLLLAVKLLEKSNYLLST